MTREKHNARPRDFQPWLAELGRRLRAARQAEELSLAELARRSGLSRRYLTEAEAGRANPTLTVMARLCGELGQPIGDLLGPPPGRAERGRVALVGLRGAGKTTVGRLLARSLSLPFVELDRRAEELAGLSLAEIFATHGEEGFRRFESEALERVVAEHERAVIAAGGSIVASAETFARLRHTCRTVWLRARPEQHLERVRAQGDRRPMRGRPRAMQELRQLLARREPLYARCEHAVDTERLAPDQVAAEIAAWLDGADGRAPAPQAPSGRRRTEPRRRA